LCGDVKWRWQWAAGSARLLYLSAGFWSITIRTLPSSKKEAHLIALFRNVRTLCRPVPGPPVIAIRADIVSFVQIYHRLEYGLLISESRAGTFLGEQVGNNAGIVFVSSCDVFRFIFFVAQDTCLPFCRSRLVFFQIGRCFYPAYFYCLLQSFML
jgi:hypothetical protein